MKRAERAVALVARLRQVPRQPQVGPAGVVVAEHPAERAVRAAMAQLAG